MLKSCDENILSVEEFCSSALQFKKELADGKNFNEMYILWQKTKIPYNIRVKMPHSVEYKETVLAMYAWIVGNKYETSNEMTSTKNSEEDFFVGHPWVTKRLDIVGSEMAKIAQAMRAMHKISKSRLSVLEFGSGWGNLALPLARSGQDVTVVDIDRGFLDRLSTIFSRENLKLNAVHDDFIRASERIEKRFDAVIFQASFHHCIDFDRLLSLIADRLLESDGEIYFLSEPIERGYPIPWGLRYDGEALWAIMCNEWLELGFSLDFFSELTLRNGMFLTEIPPIPGIVGSGWKAVQGVNGIDMSAWILPEEFDQTFHSSHIGGRFCKLQSNLPSLYSAKQKKYVLHLVNREPVPLTITLRSGSFEESKILHEGDSLTTEVPAAHPDGLVLCVECHDTKPDKTGAERGIELMSVHLIA